MNKGFYNNNNKEWAEKVKSFFKESGFYVMVVVGLCILAVGAVYFTTNHLISAPEEYEDNLISDGAISTEDDNEEIVLLDDKTTASDDLPRKESDADDTPSDLSEDGDFSFNIDNEIPDDNSEKTDSDEQDVETHAKPTIAPTKAPEPTKAPAPSKSLETTKKKDEDSREVINLFGKAPEFIMPVDGNIIMDYAMDRLLYSKTLDEWRIHTGIDIAAPRGEVVKAAGDGFIKEIKEDPCYGITITIDHENGYKTIYSNLATDSMVSVNQKVKAGDAISSVGNTAIFECMDPPHLHFEVYKNDKLIDPKTVLPKLQE
jgi:murein DD-endopeptidase MepM/ murein hydrolase activator NlpD